MNYKMMGRLIAADSVGGGGIYGAGTDYKSGWSG